MAAHYLPNLRKIITKKKKKAKPARTWLSEPLDFHTERSRASTVSAGAAHASEPPNPLVPFGNPLRPQLIRQRVAAAVPVPEELQHWAHAIPWRGVIYVAVAVALVVGVCGGALIVASNTGARKPVCDKACMEYTTLLGKTMNWSVAPCQDFHGFVCGKMKDNETSVRHLMNRRFLTAVLEAARREDIPAEGQTAAQRAARLFKTCDDVVTQDTDYVPRLRGYMRDANLHWPQHPLKRGTDSVDVLTSMLEISDKWGWPCLFEFYTEGVRGYTFELHVRPTLHLEEFQDKAIALGVGSPAHRKYFETLYTHYGGGVSDGVTFEEMVDYEVEIMDPLMYAYFLPPETFVYQRVPSDTSGMWERWTSTIAKHYGLTGNELIEIITTKRQYFDMILELIATKENIVELVIGWLCVQYTSWFSNRQLIANFYNYSTDIAELHRRICLAYTLSRTGIALFVPFMQRIYTEPVREDASRIALAVRRTVYQTLGESTYPWLELGSVFIYFDTAVAHDLEARYAHFPDMEASFVKNQRDANKAHRLTDLRAIAPMDPSWVLVDDLYRPRPLEDRADYALKPSILTSPMYDVSAPTPVRLGTFGVEVAKATVHTYEGQVDTSAEWIEEVEHNALTAVALDVALSVLKQGPSFDSDRLPNVPLTGHQLFYVIHCYTYCGDQGSRSSCNEPLRHKEDFASAFSCAAKSNMRSEYQCKSF
ncbi:hypothetical protein HPB52_003197 [Rhipicephalus sanguineus]|uniref:Uncharacterized protein n=1 Tax=Rhipicephalus sanguineus TaxID=34632 RepID=A0A9D4PM98_RHISA|nr:hypothetical protein HPB52_003197 [Rhipicephalus sanguineus]